MGASTKAVYINQGSGHFVVKKIAPMPNINTLDDAKIPK
jgi:hypothetical protein